MTTLSIIGIILLILIVMAGVLIKRRTRSILRDMDGFGEIGVLPEEDQTRQIVTHQ